MTATTQDSAGTEPRTGILLVRTWLHDGTLVSRVTRTPDIGSVDPETVVLAGHDRLRREFESWLREVDPAHLGADDET